MDYRRIYNSIIEKFRGTQPEGYVESHHIVPRCLGGGNEPANLVNLPARYHFVAHLLLAKIYGGKLVYAAWRMLTSRHYTSREYEWLHKHHSATTAHRMRGNKYGEKLKGRKNPKMSQRLLGNKINKGRKHTLETRSKVAAASKRRGVTSEMANKSWETRRKNGTDKHTSAAKANIKASHAEMSGSNNPMFGRKHSAETKAKMALKAAARMKGNQSTKGMRFKKIDGKMVRIK